MTPETEIEALARELFKAMYPDTMLEIMDTSWCRRLARHVLTERRRAEREAWLDATVEACRRRHGVCEGRDEHREQAERRYPDPSDAPRVPEASAQTTTPRVVDDGYGTGAQYRAYLASEEEHNQVHMSMDNGKTFSAIRFNGGNAVSLRRVRLWKDLLENPTEPLRDAQRAPPAVPEAIQPLRPADTYEGLWLAVDDVTRKVNELVTALNALRSSPITKES